MAWRTLLALTIPMLAACAAVAETGVTVGDWRSWAEEQAHTQAVESLVRPG